MRIRTLGKPDFNSMRTWSRGRCRTLDVFNEFLDRCPRNDTKAHKRSIPRRSARPRRKGEAPPRRERLGGAQGRGAGGHPAARHRKNTTQELRSDDSWTARVNKPRGAIIDPRPEWPPFARSGVDVKHPLRIAALDASTGRTPALRRPRCNGKNAQIAGARGRLGERAKSTGLQTLPMVQAPVRPRRQPALPTTAKALTFYSARSITFLDRTLYYSAAAFQPFSGGREA